MVDAIAELVLLLRSRRCHIVDIRLVLVVSGPRANSDIRIVSVSVSASVASGIVVEIVAARAVVRVD